MPCSVSMETSVMPHSAPRIPQAVEFWKLVSSWPMPGSGPHGAGGGGHCIFNEAPLRTRVTCGSSLSHHTEAGPFCGTVAMLPLGASKPQGPNTLPNLMEKGLKVLRSVCSRDSQAPEWTPRPRQHSLSKSAQAISWYCRRQNELAQNPSPEDRSFLSEVETMRKVFLSRPGCPQFCTRATSMSDCGTAVACAVPEQERPGSESWKMIRDSFSSQRGSDMKVDATPVPEYEEAPGKCPGPPVQRQCQGHRVVLTPGLRESCGMLSASLHLASRYTGGPHLAFSKSACEFNYLRKKSKTPTLSPVLGLGHLGKRTPWYISVIHEKDYCLSMLVEEVQRLSQLKVQVQKKDERILMLQEEAEVLKKQLKYLLRSKFEETFLRQGVKEQPSDGGPKQAGGLSAQKASSQDEEEELQRWGQMQEEYVMMDRARDLEGRAQEKEGLEGEAKRAAGAESKDAVGTEGAVHEGGEEEEEWGVAGLELEIDEKESLEEEEGGRKRICSMDEDFEEELIAQLEEYEQVIQEFQFELEVARARQSLATGACISLQRQVDYQESQLQKMNMANELLQKELREREHQIQAMTDKFSSLRDEKKQKELTGLVEKDNLLLRQKVWDLEHELMDREDTISKTNAQVRELQTQVDLSQAHLQRQRRLQEETETRMETVQEAEQQTRVALESTQARLEKLRNKIMQAAYSVSGIKSLTTEISDQDILEALQRIITERTDYYNQLRQKGVKVPPLQQSELFSSPSRSKKLAK
ncbi:LOW QUALITY PROTEIN: coiled-coil domain-containing protein 27 [Rhynchonycteris naso]